MEKMKSNKLTAIDEILWTLNRETPGPRMIQFFSEVDLTKVEALREQLKNGGQDQPSYTAFVIKAAAKALREHPYANRRPFVWPFIRRIVEFPGVNIAVAVERTASAELIFDADTLSLQEIVQKLRGFSDPAQKESWNWTGLERLARRCPVLMARFLASLPRFIPRLWVKYRAGSTLVTSPSKYGVDMVCGSWQWPVAFSFGLVKPRAVAVEGRVEVRRTCMVGMAFDPNLMLGAPAARFFSRFVELLGGAEDFA
jgi:hypothetical protein